MMKGLTLQIQWIELGSAELQNFMAAVMMPASRRIAVSGW
jgi:hypothetical protein